MGSGVQVLSCVGFYFFGGFGLRFWIEGLEAKDPSIIELEVAETNLDPKPAGQLHSREMWVLTGLGLGLRD